MESENTETDEWMDEERKNENAYRDPGTYGQTDGMRQTDRKMDE